MTEETQNQNTPVSDPPPATEKTAEQEEKIAIQDDVKWLEERLDKQDLTLTELKQALLTLTETKKEQPELFSKKMLETLEQIASTLNQRMVRNPKPSTQTKTDTPLNQPASQTATTNQDVKEPAVTQDKNVAHVDKSVLRFRRRAI